MPIPAKVEYTYCYIDGEKTRWLSRSNFGTNETPGVYHLWNSVTQTRTVEVPEWEDNDPFEATVIFDRKQSSTKGVYVFNPENETNYFVPFATLRDWVQNGVIEGGAMHGVFRVRKGRHGNALEAVNYLLPERN